jgi:hypothetical protein
MDMRFGRFPRSSAWLLAAALLMTSELCCAQSPSSGTKAATNDSYQSAAEQYARARRAFGDEAGAYWRSITEKRQIRNAKRRNNEPIQIDDYVLTQPPVYAGPPRRASRTSPYLPIFSKPRPSNSVSSRNGPRASSRSSGPTPSWRRPRG